MEFKDIKRTVEQHLGNKVTKVVPEGPRIVVYVNNGKYFAEHLDEIKELASQLKKRIILRSSVSGLLDPQATIKKIKAIIPEDANITDINFDPYFENVYIEAEKLGMVIGKHGETLNEVWKQTGWNAIVVRKPQINAEIVDSIRKTIMGINTETQRTINLAKKKDWKELFEGPKNLMHERQEILQDIGFKIYRSPLSPPDWARIMPLGGASEVGRSAFLLKTPESNILLDCGINVAAQEKNRFPDFRAADLAIDRLDAVVISHAHMDHCGFLPYLFHYGYCGPVYCTEPTRDLMILLLLDAMNVLEKNEEKALYSAKDIREVIKHTITLDYNEVANITPDMKLTLYNAGHILGSSIVHIHIGEGMHNLVYTGDMKFGDVRLLEPAQAQFLRVETLVIEGTYGGKDDEQPDRKDAEENFIKKIQETIDKKGKILIPAFAVGRSQDVMLVLERHREINVPIYLDGMIWEATGIHTTYPEYLNSYLKNRIYSGDSPFLYENFHKVGGMKEREEIINSPESCIIITTAGMMTGGPVLEYLKGLSGDEKNTLLFVGYQANGSLGNDIQNKVKEVVLPDKEGKAKRYEINMQISTVDGFSGHADKRQLLGYIKKINPKPKKIFVVHGEKEKCINFAYAINKFFGIDAVAPQNFDGLRIA